MVEGWRGGVNSCLGKEGKEREREWGVSKELIDWPEIFYFMLERERGGGVEGKSQSCSGT